MQPGGVQSLVSIAHASFPYFEQFLQCQLNALHPTKQSNPTHYPASNALYFYFIKLLYFQAALSDSNDIGYIIMIHAMMI